MNHVERMKLGIQLMREPAFRRDFRHFVSAESAIM